MPMQQILTHETTGRAFREQALRARSEEGRLRADVKRRRLDPEGAQVYVPLTTMVDFVVDGVRDQLVDDICVLPECRHRLSESLARDLGPEPIQIRGAGVPVGEQFVLWSLRVILQWDPLITDYTANRRHRHREYLDRQCPKGPHSGDREGE